MEPIIFTVYANIPQEIRVKNITTSFSKLLVGLICLQEIKIKIIIITIY